MEPVADLELVVTAVGRDRPGIVAAVTRVLFELGCNLADCSMTRLADQFAMILLVQAPAGLGLGRLEQALEAPGTEFKLTITVTTAPHPEAAPGGAPHVISVYGADHPGIIYKIASELAQRHVNITDLVSRVVGNNIYTVVLDVDLPQGLAAPELQEDLRAICQNLGVDFSLRAAEAEEL